MTPRVSLSCGCVASYWRSMFCCATGALAVGSRSALLGASAGSRPVLSELLLVFFFSSPPLLRGLRRPFADPLAAAERCDACATAVSVSGGSRDPEADKPPPAPAWRST